MRGKVANAKKARWEARRSRVQKRIARSQRVRLTVFRSAKHIYAQLDDPLSGRTIGTVSTRSKTVCEGLASTGNLEAAKKVGTAVAALAREHQIQEVVFNRNGFLVHGRVRALVEAAREAGLQF